MSQDFSRNAGPPIDESGPVPEIYADGFQGVSVTNGVAKINFFSAYGDSNGHNRRKVVLRLVLPVAVISGAQNALSQVLEDLKRQGIVMEVPAVRQ